MARPKEALPLPARRAAGASVAGGKHVGRCARRRERELSSAGGAERMRSRVPAPARSLAAAEPLDARGRVVALAARVARAAL